jgi:hypothetical protein
MSKNKLVLPQFEHSYETIIHKNVYSFCILIIPIGIPSYIWIRQDGVYLQNDLETKKILSYVEPSLKRGQGTLLYGTYFQYNGIFFYAIEDILYYKGNNISNKHFRDKLNTIEIILKKDIQQQPTQNVDEIIIGLPIITTINELKHLQFSSLPYNVKYIQFRNDKQAGNHRFQMPYYNFDEKYCTMNISADIEQDIYYLFDDYGKSVGLACIPDYKTSVFMNSIFRNIKGNVNLDAIEESDDDDDDESDFVDVNKKCKIKCKYSSYFKKWIPLEIINTNNTK